MPSQGIVVQSPNHTQVSFTANGVRIQIASTILLQATINKSLDITLLEGHPTVSTGDSSQTLQLKNPRALKQIDELSEAIIVARALPTVNIANAQATLATLMTVLGFFRYFVTA